MIIAYEGGIGLDKVLVEFGRIEKTKLQIDYDELNELINRIKILIKGDRTNRTLIHKALNNYKNNVTTMVKNVKSLMNSLEMVTINELDWKDFVKATKFIAIPNLVDELQKLDR